MKAKKEDNYWRELLEKIKNDTVSTVTLEERKEEAKLNLAPETIIYNLFKGNYVFSVNDYTKIYKEINKLK